MVRLTADLVFQASHYFNAVREREIDLRGNKIPAIENLGATEDLFDSLDLSDNEIVKLEGFPLLKRVTTLLLNNNRITRVSTSVGAQLPNLRTLILSNNRLTNLSDLDPLAYLRKLETLSLLDNVVAKKPKYRLYVINLLPKLRILDFRKVKPKERAEAKALFRKGEAKKRGDTFVPGEALEGQTAGGEKKEGDEQEREGEAREAAAEEERKTGPTPEQLTAIKAAIATAQTLEEVARLEKALKSGIVPAGLAGLTAEGEKGSSDPMAEG